MSNIEGHSIFISYASPDRERVMEFYDYLTSLGLDIWMDKRKLIGGQNWDFEIKRALAKAAMVIVFLSENSVDRRGYAQREIKIALDHALDKLVDDIYLIPVMLDSGIPIPDQLKDIQAISADDNDANEQIATSINHQLERLGIEVARVQNKHQLKWSFASIRDSWDGIPGYETEVQLIKFSSEENPQISEVSDLIKGWLVSVIMEQRQARFEQDPERFNVGETRSFRQNSFDVSCGEPKFKGRVMSIAYSAWWFSAKAAHPNHFFHTFVFTLDPLVKINSLRDMFEQEDEALEIIRTESRNQLLNQKFEGMMADDEILSLPEDMVLSGTESWEDFGSFAFGEDGLELMFDPYAVAAYAFGPQFVTIPYTLIARAMKKHFAFALDIEHLMHDKNDWPFSAPNS